MEGLGSYYGYMIVAGLLSVVGFVVSNILKSKFQKYSQVGLSNGMSGREIAEAMLRHYNISGVRVVEHQGFLSDHYNPATRTVALSPEIFHGRSVMAAAVAAHECGHAVQHDQAYAWLQMRSKLVPVVNVAAQAQQWLLIIAFLTLGTMPQLMLIVIIAFAMTTIFSFVTLPVEFDASNRALAWLDRTGTTRGQEYAGAKDALKWAAMTYVSAALSSLVMLLYLIMRYQNR
jgi:Zn-dependent membrane protease YugP